MNLFRPPASGTPVSRFALYGEKPGEDDPEFVHIEDIQIRSSLYGWRIAPHLHRRMFQVVFVIDGPAIVQLEDARHEAHAPCAVCLPGDVVHGFDFTRETIGYVVTVSERLLLDAAQQSGPAHFDALLAEARIVAFDGGEDVTFATTLLEQMSREFQARDHGRNAMFEWLLNALLMTIRRRLALQSAPDDGHSSGRDRFAEACRLIEDHYREHLPVTAYSERLAMTQARLNRLCRRFSGKTFSDLLHDRLTLEAQRYLIYTSATAEMVAYELGYADPAYFSRVFKRRTGRTPGAFRRERRVAD
ncbi:helix-turn-helix domain-containing protein [Microbaculum marinum]|uniref:Helix-turn-helix domain-containing protein n=1 Tax=Microbaculum marinum TaxID=1764581 RepID=A0AAW9RJ14_9HYPH